MAGAADPATNYVQAAPINGGSRPIPDPTVQTDAAIAKLKESMTDYIDGKFDLLTTRMNGADEATKLRLATIEHVPALIDDKVAASRDVIETRLTGMDELAKARAELGKDALTAAFNAAKEAVAAALTAQKEAAAKQDEANQKAIDKSEKATAETIKTNQTLGAAITDGLRRDVDETKSRTTAIESTKLGAGDNQKGLYQAIAAAGGVLGIIGIIAAILSARGGA